MKGRDADFKCAICGRFTPYDRRKVIVTWHTIAVFSVSQEQYFPEDIIEMTHKKCKTKSKPKGVTQ